MHFNLNKTKQRKLFWKECEVAVLNANENAGTHFYGWKERGKLMSALETFHFWDQDETLWGNEAAGDNISEKAIETFNYYEFNGTKHLNGHCGLRKCRTKNI